MIDFDAANAFVLALGKDPGSIRLRGFYPSGHPLKDSDSGRKSGPDRDTITRWQAEGRGVYLVINDGGDTDADITACRAFFAEWDDKPKDWQVTAWQEFDLPEPTIQVDTGGKSIHNYWVLSEPVSSEIWKPIQTRLLDYLEADTKLKNPSRVMRLPGAMHMDKNGTPDGRSDIIHTSDNHYTAEEFAARIPTEQQLYEPVKFTDYPSTSTPDEIRDALAFIPPRKPGTGTYDIYRNILWGLIKATGNEDEAISLMQSHSPEWKGIQQVARSGGARVNESTFWYWAKHYGFKRRRPVRDLPPLQPPGGSSSPDLPADNTPFRCLGFNRNNYYYMPNRGGQVIELSAGAHTKNNLMTLAPLTWWATLFQTEKGAIDWDSAVNSLITRCQATGIYSPSLVRGRGAWCDGNSVIVHLGNRLIADGAHIPKPHQFQSRYFYENSESLDGPSDTPLSDADATRLANISNRFSWESPVSANLLLGWIVLAPVCGALSWRPHIWVTGAAGSGKAQPHSAKILTPTGWRTMGDIAVGDLVSTPDNGFARVRGKFPQGAQPTYKITFADGRSTRATGDHLWKVRVSHSWRLRTTEEMIQMLSTETRQSRSLAIPLCKPMTVRNGGAASMLPLHPYALGIMLGDGSFTEDGGNNLTVFDPEIVDRARKCLEGSIFNFFDTNVEGRYRLGDLSRYGKQTRKTIKELRLLGTKSDTKFIPRAYLDASVEDRLELLRGLMDTDGTSGIGGNLSYCTVSEQLRDDVVELVRSLGGIANVGVKASFYTHHGERRRGKKAFIISIRLPDPTVAFSLERKLARVSADHQYADCLYLNVVSIELDEPEQCSCIAIDHPDRLYVTDDFVVTHNTTVLRDFMRPLLGGIFKAATGGTTEAGIRGALRSDAIPVLFDEFEQNELKDKSLVQSVLALARVASSEGGQIIKGTATGGTAAYDIRSMFCFSSITVGIFQKADFDRICVLSLVPAKDKPKEHWEALRREITQHCTEEVGRMLVARTIKHIPTIRTNSKVFASVLAEGYGQRFGDQNGALLAGAWSLMPAGVGDREVTIEEARAWVGSMDMSSKQVDETDADENKCLNYILQYLLQVGAGKKMSMLELVTDYVKGRRIVSHSSFDDGESIDTLIGRYGLRVIDDTLVIANNNANLASILRDTPWANNAFRQSLKRIPGASASANPVRFAGSGVSRATVIPLATFLE